MGIVICSECGKDISDKALVCPSCGYRYQKNKRSFLGKIIKWSFVLFNILMLLWVITGMGETAQLYESYNNEWEKTGAAIGTGIGIMMILFIWTGGAVILGLLTLLTRPKNT